MKLQVYPLWIITIFSCIYFSFQASSQVVKAGSKEDLPETSFNDLNIKIIKDILTYVQNEVIRLEEDFHNKVVEEIQQLGQYSPANVAQFSDFLSQRLQSFVGSTDSVTREAQNRYFQFLDSHGQGSDDPFNLTPDQIALYHQIDDICKAGIDSARALILNLTSPSMKLVLGQQLTQGFTQAREQATQRYLDQREENERGLNRTSWDELKAIGVDMMASLQPHIQDEIQKQAQIYIDKVTSGFLSNIARQGSNLSSGMSKNVSNALADLSKRLSLEGLAVFTQRADVPLKLLRNTIRSAYKLPSMPKEIITVDPGIELCVQEKEFLEKRMPLVQHTLKTNFGIAAPLRLAFCCSGGGSRAMIGTIGILMAAAELQYLQSSLYVAGLSGSTWAIAPWNYLYLKGLLAKDLKQSFLQMRKNLMKMLSDPSMVFTNGIYLPPWLSDDIQDSFSLDMAVRFAFEQPISLINVYGAMIGNFALMPASNRLNIKWSSVARLAGSPDIPLPLCAAAYDLKLLAPTKFAYLNYGWFEMSPFQAGGIDVGYISPVYLGSKFNKDGLITSDGIKPEYSLAFFMGIYGSAISVSSHDVINFSLKDPKFSVAGITVVVPVGSWIHKIVDNNFGPKAVLSRSGFIHAQLANYSKGSKISKLEKEENIGLFDAGMTLINAPLPILLERKDRAVDVVIVYDSNPGDADMFYNSAAYFKSRNIAFPEISKQLSKESLQAKAMTVFNDPRDKKQYDPKIATIVYFPTLGIDISKAPFITSNFKYTQDDIETLSDNTYRAFKSQDKELRNIMQLVAKARYPKVVKAVPIN